MLQKCTPTTLESYTIDYYSTVHPKLLTLIDLLSLDRLIDYFSNGEKRKISLSGLVKDEHLSRALSNRINRLMGEFLDLVHKHQLPICLDVQRKVILESIRLKLANQPISANLRFEKTQVGMQYFLYLTHLQKSYIPSNHDVYLINDMPGYVIIDYILYPLHSINANKIKPFLKKQSVFIPNRILEDYFNKFIKDVAGKVDTEAVGFEKEEKSLHPKCQLVFSKDLIHGRYIINYKFMYEEASFNEYDTSLYRVNINFLNGLPRVHIIRRDKQEEARLIHRVKDKLHNDNLVDEHDDIFKIFYDFSLLKGAGELHDYEIKLPKINGKQLNLDRPSLQFSFKKGMDWFDLHTVIQVGDYHLLFSDLLEHIKKDDRLFDLPDGTVFIIPQVWMSKYRSIANHVEVYENKVRLNKMHFTLIDELNEESSANSNNSQKVYSPSVEVQKYELPATLNAKLRSYQSEGVQWLINHYEEEFGALLADDMGLGKTLQTITALLYAKEKLITSGQKKQMPTIQQLSLFEQSYREEFQPLNSLIVLPTSLIYNWHKELSKFAPGLTVTLYVGPQRHQIKIDTFDVIITTYQTASRDIDILKTLEYTYVVLDESQYIKNRNSKVFTKLSQLKAKAKISLSGTPIENSLADLYAQMQFINPDILGKYEFFKKVYEQPISRHRDEDALRELQQILRPFILRRTREEVLGDLPALEEHVIYTSMTKEQAKLFENEKSKARNMILGMDQFEPGFQIHVLTSLMRLRQISNHPKLVDEDLKIGSGKFDDVTHYLKNIVQARGKVLVFSSFVKHLGLYMEWCSEEEIKFSKLTGDMAARQREQEVAKFKSQVDVQVMFISLKAGGTGLNLTDARYIVILDPWWNPFAEKQAIARAHRLGQEHKVSVARFVSKDSIEEKILALQQEKIQISDDLFSTESKESFTKAELSTLLS